MRPLLCSLAVVCGCASPLEQLDEGCHGRLSTSACLELMEQYAAEKPANLDQMKATALWICEKSPFGRDGPHCKSGWNRYWQSGGLIPAEWAHLLQKDGAAPLKRVWVPRVGQVNFDNCQRTAGEELAVEECLIRIETEINVTFREGVRRQNEESGFASECDVNEPIWVTAVCFQKAEAAADGP